MGLTLRGARLRLVWLLVLPFLAFSTPRSPWLAVGGALAVPGLWLRAWSAGTIQKDRRLTVEGPYAFTRNPLYVGSLLLGAGIAIAGGHWIWPVLFLAFFAAVYPRVMAAEARHLEDLFPERYAGYAAHVPAFLPRLTPYRPGRPPEESAGRSPGRFPEGPRRPKPAPAESEALPALITEPDRGFRWARYTRNKEWEALLGTLGTYVFLVLKALLRE